MEVQEPPAALWRRLLPGGDLPGEYRLPIPHYYFDQMQGIMGALKLPFAEFIVWTSKEMQITHVPFLPGYWKSSSSPRCAPSTLTVCCPPPCASSAASCC